jgi:L-fuculose-phosphate aldolase
MAMTGENSTQATSRWLIPRMAVMEGAQAMFRAGLVVGSSGNVSARCSADGADYMAVTATGKDYERLTLKQIVVVDLDGEPVVGDAVPSSETLVHAAIYAARPDVGAVMHTHSVYASGLAVAGVSLPPLIDEMVLVLGGGIEVSNYAFPGTDELGTSVVAALGERNAALIRNHGVVGVGATVAEAFDACQLVERLAQIYNVANAAGSAPALAPDVVASEIELFRMRRRAEGGG